MRTPRQRHVDLVSALVCAMVAPVVGVYCGGLVLHLGWRCLARAVRL